ncbi:MAG: 1-deoxy-D-xylulose-5-phosphate reductoisomerase [Acholeplasmatales bacterium]|jgi:1-deoxy-D-xylulose-5-phosphate reductoisomerase|nr:1-deoxy-D-xylulose-5-phosphate reductoisomerase [Acholeplasmatales bacterium]
MKYVYILGSLGSIGMQTLEVIRENKDEFKVIGLSLGRNLELAKEICEEFKPEIISLREKKEFKLSYNPIITYGDEGLLEVAKYHKYDNEVLVNALVGMSGLLPTVYAIKAKKNLALANKETLVVAGDIIKDLIKEYNVSLTPIDSEHSAILECLKGEDKKDIKRLIITASGGSFRNKKREELINVTKKDALCHPNWSMGEKITIDSATMMNKGFEIIEAHYLFDVPYEKITPILHPQSIIHSMVEYNDGTIKASLGPTSMMIPIKYALRYPSHDGVTNAGYLDLIGLNLTFNELSEERYPCLKYAYYAAKKGGIYYAVLNASNEAAVKLFLEEKIKFLDIEKIIENEINNPIYEKYEYNLENIIKVSKDIINDILGRY